MVSVPPIPVNDLRFDAGRFLAIYLSLGNTFEPARVM
jgi:hypothetical protein